MTTIIFSGNDFTFLSDDYGTGLESFWEGVKRAIFLTKLSLLVDKYVS